MQSLWASSYNLLIFDELGSTNAEALKIAQTHPIGNFVISAKKQTAGRGRRGKAWESESGNLHMSILIKPEVPEGLFAQVSFVAAVALYRALTDVIKGHKISLKWPNDVLVDGAKIAGILLEASGEYLVVGVGLNIKHHPTLQDRATTSLAALGCKDIKVDEMIDLIMSSFEYYYKIWINKGFAPIRKDWLIYAHEAGAVLTINDGKERISGEFVDIDHIGSIRIKLTSGEVCSMSTGEVFLLDRG